jgi:hypothetical protein
VSATTPRRPPLRLRGASLGDEGAVALIGSSFVAELESLDLGDNRLTLDGLTRELDAVEHRLQKMRTVPFGKAVEQRDEAFFGETARQLTAAPALTAVLAQRVERPMRPHQATGSRPPP